jgi:endo-beta-N-acetylglucosaminidase D
MNNIIIFGIIFVMYWAWIGYEVWRAPMMRENEDGSYTTIRGEKKLSDLFKKKK